MPIFWGKYSTFQLHAHFILIYSMYIVRVTKYSVKGVE